MGNCLSCLSHGNELKGKETIGGTARTKQAAAETNSSTELSVADRATQNGERKKSYKKPANYDPSSNSPSNSSDSDVCSGKIHKSRKTQSKNGTIMMVSNTTTVGGNIINIKGDGTVVNLGDRSARPKKRKERPHETDRGYIILGPTRTSQFAALESDDVYVDFGFLSKTNVGAAENIFYLTSNVVFHDEDLDIAVIELRSGQAYPPPFLKFSQATSDSKFTFVGHPFGEPKQLNDVDGLLQIDEQNKRQAVEWSRSVAGIDGFAGIDIPGRILFNCSFQKGGSGSPGIAVVGGQPVVVTVLLHGYPDWYYNPNLDQRIKNSVENQQRVEQGVDMKSLYFKMHSVDRDLCYAIFGANP